MLLTNLPKAFDYLRHDLLIAKLAAHGFDQPSLCFIFSYLSDRTQRTKVNNAYSSYTDIKYGVPQGSILGPLLFNIDICNLFFWDYKCDIASYADGFIFRASVFTWATSTKISTRSKLVKLLPLLHISPRIRSIMCTIIVVQIMMSKYCYSQCNVLFPHVKNFVSKIISDAYFSSKLKTNMIERYSID